MVNKRTISKRALPSSSTLRDAGRDRPARPEMRPEVREEPLRATSAAGRAVGSAIPLSAWRGHSGRRYVVGVHAPTSPDLGEIRGAVVLAVRRDAAGRAEVVERAAALADEAERLPPAFADRARLRGATEFHVHRLAVDAAARGAVLADLG